MDHATMNHVSMTMDMSTLTATGTAAAASATAAVGMGGMNHGGGMGGCKISMLWNWNTIDSCFISSSWRVTSSGMFAGSCIGVILLVVSLEFLRRAVKEFDAFLIRQNRAHAVSSAAAAAPSAASSTRRSSEQLVAAAADGPGFRPTVVQQAIRAFLHTLQFAVTYFVMLLAMYYNGYIIICIFISAFLGAFIFQWESLGSRAGNTSPAKEATVCCG